MTFDKWMEEFEPETVLTYAQRRFIRELEQGHVFLWTSGHRSGHTTAIELWCDYLHHVTQNPTMVSNKESRAGGGS